MSDVDNYIAKCKIAERVQESLEELFSQGVLPYNPYRTLIQQFLSHSESFHMTKSHLDTGRKRPVQRQTIKVGSLHRSKDVPNVWGLPQLIKWVKSEEINELLGNDLTLFTTVSGNKDCAISLLIPTCFHKSLYGKIRNQIYFNIDIVIQDSSYDDAKIDFISILQKETVNTPKYSVVCLQVVSDETDTFTISDIEDGILQKDKVFSTLSNITSLHIEFILIRDNGDIFHGRKYYTFYHVRKKTGKFLSTSYCNPPLLNLFTGVLLSGAELYETCLFQSLFVPKDQVIIKGNKDVKIQLGPSHPLVQTSVEKYITTFLKTEKYLDFFRFLDGLVVQYFFLRDEESSEILNEIFWVHRGASKYIYDVLELCSLVENLVILYQNNSNNAPIHIIAPVVENLFKLFEQPLPLTFSKSVPHRRFSNFLRKTNNVMDLQNLFYDDESSTFSNFLVLISIDKMSCVVFFLYFLTPALNTLPVIKNILSHEGQTSPTEFEVPKGHSFLDNPNITTACTVPAKSLSLSLHNTLMDVPHYFGIDVKKSSGQIQSAPNMHTVSVLLKYQNDLLLDTTLEHVISSVSSSLEENPYNEFVSEFMNLSFKVDMDCISESSISSIMLKKPKLVDSDYQIFSVLDQKSKVFGLHHTLLSLDMDGIRYCLQICDLIMNKPKITKKYGVRVRPVVIPSPKMVLVGQLCPVIYSFVCEELYVLIKEKPSASLEIAISYLSEIIIDHLVELSIIAEVVDIVVHHEEQHYIDLNMLTENKDNFKKFLENLFNEQSLVSIEFFLQIDNGYIKVLKDLKPMFIDKTNDFSDMEVLSEVTVENSFFPVFSKLYQAKFFYDYDEVLEKTDLNFVINRLNKGIVKNQDCWDVYLDIQLKKVLTQDNTFLATAYKASHSHCYKLNSLQDYNVLISDVIKQILRKPGNLIDKDLVKSMLHDFCSALLDCTKKTGVPETVQLLINIDLNFIYNAGDPALDQATVESLRNLWICCAALCELYKREMFGGLPAIQNEITLAATEINQYFDI